MLEVRCTSVYAVFSYVTGMDALQQRTGSGSRLHPTLQEGLLDENLEKTQGAPNPPGAWHNLGSER